MSVLNKVQDFIIDLRNAGIPVSPGDAEDCLRGLLMIDWSAQPVFYATLFSTLLKESSFIPIFNEIYKKHFLDTELKKAVEEEEEKVRGITMEAIGGHGISFVMQKANQEIDFSRRQKQTKSPIKQRSLLTLDFYDANYSASQEDLRRMEQLIPLLGKRLASRMIMKKKRQEVGNLDFRRTVRHSMSTGGVPVDIFVKHKRREKPVIFTLCDVSQSCLYFSYFSLAMVHSLEKFFRQVRSFAFIDETDEITSIVKREPYYRLRKEVFSQAMVSTSSGYTDYGRAFETFVDKYGRELNHKSSVLIFGDARTNWFSSRTEILRDLQKKVRHIYWFNPEGEHEWNTGDSSMNVYKKYCTRAFECANLEQLAQAVCEIE
ncbi:MAG: VWA domain-containing protein [Candidatus Saccharibacteria bacterium]